MTTLSLVRGFKIVYYKIWVNTIVKFILIVSTPGKVFYIFLLNQSFYVVGFFLRQIKHNYFFIIFCVIIYL